MAIEKRTVDGNEIEWDIELNGAAIRIEQDNDRKPKAPAGEKPAEGSAPVKATKKSNGS
jgi:hypothetical protein